MAFRTKALSVLAASMILGGTLTAVSHAQPAPDGGGRQRGGGPGGGNFDPAQMRQRMMDRLKEQLGASDEEFAVLQPKLEAVQAAQMDARGGGFGGGRGGFGGGPGGGGFGGGRGGDQPQSPVAQRSRELGELLQNQSASADEVKTKLEALRQARAEAREKLTKAQNELKELLTPRQEAMLVVAGMLE